MDWTSIFQSAGIAEYKKDHEMGLCTVDFYLPAKNTVVEFLDDSHFCFNRKDLNSNGRFRMRLLENLECKPNVVLASQSLLFGKKDNKNLRDVLSKFKD